MAGSLTESLLVEIEQGRAIVVVGAGVSIAATGGAPTASWLGLIRSGVEHAKMIGGLPSGWEENLLSDLTLGAGGSSSYLISAAAKVTQALGGKTGGEFKSWLRQAVGQLHVTEPDVIRAIAALNAPILTTNYDSLIEDVVSIPSATWQQPSQVQSVLQGTDRLVVHLHGHWRSPESIILEPISYGTLASDAAAQALQKALATLKSLVLVGVGSGISDPNLGELRGWILRTFPGSELRHYVLCRDGDVEELRQEYGAEQFHPVAYGAEYSHLVPFLTSLRPTHGGSRAAAPHEAFDRTAAERGREALCESVRSDTVLSDHLPNLEQLSIEQLLIPPVLLPVAHEHYVNSLDLNREARPGRCDSSADVRDNRCIVVAAEEGTGLTSSLQWLVSEASSLEAGLVPVVVDFRKLGPGHRPLERQIRRELMMIGAISGPKDELPPCVIALDNVLTRPEKIFARALDELRNERFHTKILGCRQGSEAELLTRLKAAGIEAALRYVGKMTKRDVSRMVALVEPSRASRLAEAILSVTNREHFSRTPFTVGLLLSVLLRGEALLGTASETALLDAYVNLLLGRGDPHDDARFALDSLERSDILSSLAEQFVLRNSGSLPEHQVLEVLADYFDAVGWSEDPIEVLTNLGRRHILAVRNGQVRFTQSSFLHLFAAKKAIASRGFREVLYKRALYYAPVVRHYAALTRNDAEALKTVEGLLWSAEEIQIRPGGMFSPDDASASSVKAAVSVEDLLDRLALTPADVEGDPDEVSEEPDEGDDDDLFELIHHQDRDPDPFPLEAIEEAPAPVQVVAALMLVSNVLRDSELVKDVGLKQRVLHRTLIVWGRFIELLEDDEEFRGFALVLGEMLADVFDVSENGREKFVTRMSEAMPFWSGYGGLASTLASRKLLRVLELCFSDSEFVRDPRASVMGALLGFELQPQGWPSYFATVRSEHGEVKIVRTHLRHLALLAYYYHNLSTNDEQVLQRLLVDHIVENSNVINVVNEKNFRNRVSQRLRLNRVMASRKRVVSGQTVFSGELAAGQPPEGGADEEEGPG